MARGSLQNWGIGLTMGAQPRGILLILRDGMKPEETKFKARELFWLRLGTDH